MSFNPLVTIITVSYNSESTIKRTIESVLNQNYNNIEYIIVDNLSTDKTLNIIKSYATKFKNKNFIYRWISEKDNGIYEAMNKGITNATGEIVGIINSDDWYAKDTIKTVVKKFSNKNTDIVYGDVNYIINFKNKTYYKVEHSKRNLKGLKNHMCIHHPTAFVRKDIYYKVGMFDINFKITGDWDFISRCYTKNLKFKYINEVLANFTYGGLSSNYTYNYIYERFKVRKKNYTLTFAILSFFKEYIILIKHIALKILIPKNTYLRLKEIQMQKLISNKFKIMNIR